MSDSQMAGKLDEILGRRRRVRQPNRPIDPEMVERARDMRAYLGLSLRGFAELLGVNPGTVHRWESGRGATPHLAARYVVAVSILEERADSP